MIDGQRSGGPAENRYERATDISFFVGEFPADDCAGGGRVWRHAGFGLQPRRVGHWLCVSCGVESFDRDRGDSVRAKGMWHGLLRGLLAIVIAIVVILVLVGSIVFVATMRR